MSDEPDVDNMTLLRIINMQQWLIAQLFQLDIMPSSHTKWYQLRDVHNKFVGNVRNSNSSETIPEQPQSQTSATVTTEQSVEHVVRIPRWFRLSDLW